MNWWNKKMSVMAVNLVLALAVLGCMVGQAHAALVTQLEFTSGAVDWSGKNGRMLDRLFDQDGQIMMGQYQPSGKIVDSITKGHKTYSLFTSGMNGAPAPSAVINGNSVTADFSSLFFGWQRGDEIRVRNIGGQATGLFNPQTSEFSLSWDHLFNNGKHDNDDKHDRMHDQAGTFFIRGTAVVAAPAAVPISSSVVLFVTGLFGLGSWSWWRTRDGSPAWL